MTIQELLGPDGPEQLRSIGDPKEPKGPPSLNEILLGTLGRERQHLDNIITKRAEPANQQEQQAAKERREYLLKQDVMRDFSLKDPTLLTNALRDLTPEQERVATARVAEALNRYGLFDSAGGAGWSYDDRPVVGVTYPTSTTSVDGIGYRTTDSPYSRSTRIDPFMHGEIQKVLTQAYEEADGGLIGKMHADLRRTRRGFTEGNAAIDRANDGLVNALGGINEAVFGEWKRNTESELESAWNVTRDTVRDAFPGQGYQRLDSGTRARSSAPLPRRGGR